MNQRVLDVAINARFKSLAPSLHYDFKSGQRTKHRDYPCVPISSNNLAHLISMAQKATGKDVFDNFVDIGCGIGHVPLTLADLHIVRKAVGIDVNKEYLVIARFLQRGVKYSHYTSNTDNVEFYVRDVLELGTKYWKQYDLLYMYSIMQDTDAKLELHRKVLDGMAEGAVLITCDTYSTIRSLSGKKTDAGTVAILKKERKLYFYGIHDRKNWKDREVTVLTCDI